MTDKTLKTIALCKGWGANSSNNILDSLTDSFVSCFGHPKEYYTYNKIEQLIKNAMYEFIDTCDNPSAFLKDIFEWNYNPDSTLAEHICLAFCTVRVYESTLCQKFVNGFDERFVQICNELNKKRRK